MNIIDYLKELGIDYVPGTVVRVMAWQANSSSDHTAWLSGLPLPERLNLDDYPQLKKRTINNVLYVETTSIDDYLNKAGFFFSEDHYTIINKINYAISLACYGGGYSNSLYSPKSFMFRNKRELEESKRILIKYYTTFTKPVRLALIKYFGFDNVEFSFDKIVKIMLSIDDPDPKEVYKVLIHSGLYSVNDSDLYEAIKVKKSIDLQELFDIEGIDGNCSDSMENNIYESEETLADFLFNSKSEVFPYHEGSDDEVLDSVKSNGLVVFDKDTDDSVKLSCKALIRDIELNELKDVVISRKTSLSNNIFEDIYKLMTDMSDKGNSIRDPKTGKIIDRYQNLVNRWNANPKFVFEPDTKLPVIRAYYMKNNGEYINQNNTGTFITHGISEFEDDVITVSTYLSSGGLTDISGKLLACFLQCYVPEDTEKVREVINRLNPLITNQWLSYKSKDSSEIAKKSRRGISNEFYDYLCRNLINVGDVFQRTGVAGEVLCDMIDINNPDHFTKEEINGYTYYWIKLSSFIDLFRQYRNDIDTEYVKFCDVLFVLNEVLGPDWIDKLIYMIPIEIEHNLNK